MSPSSPSSRYAHLDALRAFAVLLVVIAHAGLESVVPGGAGVTVFFSISGFIITWLLLREREKGDFNIGGFYWRRAVKILPPLLVVVVIPTLIYSTFWPIDIWAFIGQLLFFFNWMAIDNIPRVLPGSGVVWSLAIEEQYYIGFALIWLALYRSGNYLAIMGWVAASTVLAANFARVALNLAGASEDRIYLGTDTRLDAIALGVLTAIGYYRHLRVGSFSRLFQILGSPWALSIAFILAAASLAIRNPEFRQTARYTLQSLAVCIVIAWGFVANTSFINRFLQTIMASLPAQVIGKASYSIYLVHLPIALLLRQSIATGNRFADAALLILAGCGVGIALYYSVETPILQARLRLEASKATARKSTDNPSTELS